MFVGIVHDKRVKFRDPCLNRSRDIHPKLSEAAFSTVFLNFDNCQPEVASDVIPDIAGIVTDEWRTNDDIGVRKSSHEAKTP